MKNILLLLLLFTGIVKGQIVNIPDANFKAKLVSQIGAYASDLSGNSTVIDINNDGEIQTSEALNITRLILTGSDITNLTGIEFFTNLHTIYCNNNSLETLDLSSLLNLQYLNCSQNALTQIIIPNSIILNEINVSSNNLTSINIPNLMGLQGLNCSDNNLLNLNVSGLLSLSSLVCTNNQISSLDISTLTQLTTLDCSNNLITDLDLSNSSFLINLYCNDNFLTTLDISGLSDLWFFTCSNNLISNLDFSGNNSLYILGCYNNLFETLDVSTLNLGAFSFDQNSQLQQVFMKNGSDEVVQLDGCPNLRYVCADESQMLDIQNLLDTSGLTNVVLNSYCNFVPGGDYNTINGNSRYDLDNNGCNLNDYVTEYLKITINDGTNSGSTFTNNSGNYSFYTQTGNFTITPEVENPSYFNISPTNAVINFPLLNNSTQTQNFCISPNGFHPDLEIVITPISAARPGFDANYKIVYKNKGNQVLNGIVNLLFDDVRTDFVSAVPTVDMQQTGSLTWNFSNLNPFETRAIDLVLNLNTPLENPAINSGDILHFTANTSSSIGEGTLLDNTFEFNQTVVNAIDPNEKSCLEGNVITPEDIGKYVHYNINFENLGTADAVNVVIKDIIDTTMFDLNSLQLMYASHPVETKIDGNKVEFIFENINLPPSNGNPIGGHGNVLFKIKTLPTLLVGDQIANTANIYFDYNAPIETNEARSTFAALDTSNFVKDQSISIAPNPAKNNVTVTSLGNIKSIELFDVQGRILQTILENKNTTTIDISNKSNGIYFLKVTTEIGSSVEKLVKEN